MRTNTTDKSRLIDLARDLLINEQLASISLLQRHLRVGYSYAQGIMQILEQQGIVTPPRSGGMRELTPAHQEGLPAFRDWAVSEFAGCDGGDPHGATWVLGFEHGASDGEGPDDGDGDDGNPISRQRTYRYSRQVFKLLAAIEGGAVEDWLPFAERERPFVAGSRGYFKGNLYPYPCPADDVWTDDAKRDTGFETKHRYRTWCRNHRFPVVERWIERANPRLIIATGITRRHDFVSVAFQNQFVTVEEHRVANGSAPRFFSAVRNGRLLVILPHLSGSPLFVSNATLQAAGTQIADLKRAVEQG